MDWVCAICNEDGLRRARNPSTCACTPSSWLRIYKTIYNSTINMCVHHIHMVAPMLRMTQLLVIWLVALVWRAWSGLAWPGLQMVWLAGRASPARPGQPDHLQARPSQARPSPPDQGHQPNDEQLRHTQHGCHHEEVPLFCFSMNVWWSKQCQRGHAP